VTTIPIKDHDEVQCPAPTPSGLARKASLRPCHAEAQSRRLLVMTELQTNVAAEQAKEG